MSIGYASQNNAKSAPSATSGSRYTCDGSTHCGTSLAEMDKRKYRSAVERYERAKAAADRVTKTLDLPELDTAWWTFILAAAGVYSQLEQGAKGSPKSAQWFAEVKAERKRDPMLQYLHQARNAEEHGDGGGRAHGIDAVAIKGATVNRDEDGKFVGINATVGVELNVKVIPTGIRLKPVCNFGVLYPVPSEHDGAVIAEPLSYNVMALGTEYLKKLLIAAESFIV